MASAFHGKNSVFTLEDSAGTTLRDLSPNLTNVAFSRQNDTHDNTGFGSNGHTFQVGLTNGKVTLTGWTTHAASTGTLTVLDSLMGLGTTTLGFTYDPHGTATGTPHYAAECVLESVDVSDPVADLVSFVAVLQISGSVTKTSNT